MNEQEIADLKQFYDTVKSRHTKAKKTLDNIEGLEIKYQKASDAVGRIITETEDAKNGILALQGQSKLAVEEIQKTRVEISGYLDVANGTLEKLRAVSNDAATLKGQIDGGKGEIDALLNNSRNLTDDISKLKKAAEENLTNADSLLSDFQSKAELMRVAFVEFTEIKKRIDDKDSGLGAALKLVQEAQNDSEKLVKQIDELLKTSKANEQEISVIKKRSLVSLNEINASLEEVNLKKKQVEEVSGLVIDGSFAETFEKRKKEIDGALNKDFFSWKYILFIGVVVLILIEISLGDLTGIDGFFTRLAYTSPLIFLILFSAIQYSKERQFLEMYAFKSASSAAIRNHIEFLLEKFKTDKKVLDFSIDVFASIYSEPFKQEFKKKKLKESLSKKKISIDTGIKSVVDAVDKLYEIVPDEALVKQVLEAVASKTAK